MSPKRPDDDRLLLAVRLADNVMTSPALSGPFTMELGMEPDGTTYSRVNEPDQRLLRDLISDVRKFDSPGEDVFIKDMHRILDTRIASEWRPSLEAAIQDYERSQEPGKERVQDPDAPRGETPTWIRPREAFELWIYGDMLHNDYAKEQRWARFGPLAPIVRAIGHGYMTMLVSQIEFVGRSARNGLAVALDPPPPPMPEDPNG